MAYELSFIKRVESKADDAVYINDCCLGGDAVAERILPAIRERFPSAGEAAQEDWGWAIWFAVGDAFLCVDIHGDDPEATGEYRIHLVTRRKRFFSLKDADDIPEMDELLRIVAGELAEWTGKLPAVEKI